MCVCVFRARAGSLKYMPKLRRLLQDDGVTFRHGYVSTPLCCPSRSSYLTGMFVHNHQVSGPRGTAQHGNCGTGGHVTHPSISSQ